MSLARLVVSILLPLAAGYVVLPPPRIALVTPRSGAAVGSAVADLSKLTVKQLKEKLKTAGLPVSGKKAELIARLDAARAPATPEAPPAAKRQRKPDADDEAAFANGPVFVDADGSGKGAEELGNLFADLYSQ